jgi:hypothetical protein
MGSMTSEDCCYCGARGMRVGAGTYNSDVSSDISGPLLLPPTIATGHLTLADRCYYQPQYQRAI